MFLSGAALIVRRVEDEGYPRPAPASGIAFALGHVATIIGANKRSAAPSITTAHRNTARTTKRSSVIS